MFSSSSIVRAALLLGSLLPVVRSEVFEVTVGGLGDQVLLFQPESVTAVAGDQIRFIFRQKNHTATQSTFANPCERAPGGFNSGFWPVPQEQTEGFPVAELNITSNDPIWVYCAQGNHCSSGGMVFAVNPGERFDAFKAAATGAAPPASTPAPPASTSEPAPAPSAPAGTTHRVIVGGPAGLAFDPTSLQAAIGDEVVFEFRNKNHTITRSSFAEPCARLAGATGFDSGFIPVPDGTSPKEFKIRINDTAPIWAYCAQGAHCAQGMVFAINSPETPERNFQTFLNTAKATAAGGAAGQNPYGNGALSHSFTGIGAALLALVATSLLF
ncbi:hypothetical protein FA15DRAFT_699409 [Coprinopsis marcescibilis]|uniref:Cupredoxin n=1 Tax=Coprinopsis marcescibilis TaxID=230819 RepID=A0A5C3LD17_COPMA|nr:hypothetical protein FA15DRAFT_699409 [Coprinopsis marcescibilis]